MKIKIKDAISILQTLKTKSEECTLGELVDALTGLEPTVSSMKSEKEFTTSVVENMKNYDPSEFLDKNEELRNLVEKRVSLIKNKDIAKTFDDLGLVDGEIKDAFKTAFNRFSVDHENELVTLVTVLNDLQDMYLIEHNEEMPAELEMKYLEYINNQKKIAFYA